MTILGKFVLTMFFPLLIAGWMCLYYAIEEVPRHQQRRWAKPIFLGSSGLRDVLRFVSDMGCAMSVMVTVHCNCGKSARVSEPEEFPEKWMRVGDQHFCDKCSERLYQEAIGTSEPEDKDVTISYRGFEIHVAAEGIEYKSYYVMREADGWFAKDGFEYNAESVKEMIDGWKEYVDRELEADDPFDEHYIERHGL